VLRISHFETHRSASMSDSLQQITTWLLNRVHVNRIGRCLQNRIPVWIKRRRLGGSLVIWFGNRFLTLARSRIEMFVRAHEWVKWEIHCAQLLYPRRRPVTAGAGPSVILPEVGGTSLRQLIRVGDPGFAPFVAAARELRRAHAISCPRFNGPWSHGDLHLDNVLYDAATDQAVLIDFDTRHDARLGPIQRHADDLKVMLLELVSQPDEHWHDRAAAMLQEYGNSAVLDELDGQLIVPGGFARILWHYRTNGVPTRALQPRLQSLQSIVQRVASTTAHCGNVPASSIKEGESTCLRNC